MRKISIPMRIKINQQQYEKIFSTENDFNFELPEIKPCKFRKFINNIIGHVCTKNPELIQMERSVTEFCDCEDRKE